MRTAFALLVAVLTVVALAGLSKLSFGYFRSGELEKAQGRLSLYEASLQAELERFSHLTYVLARDPFVIATAEGGQTAWLNARLAEFAAQAGWTRFS